MKTLEKINEKLHDLLEQEYKKAVTKVEDKFTSMIESAKKSVLSVEEKIRVCDALEKNFLNTEAAIIQANEETNAFYESLERDSNFAELKPIESPFDPEELIILEKDQISFILEQQNPYYDPKMEAFLEDLRDEDLIKSDRVFKTMMRINRKNFVSSETQGIVFIFYSTFLV